MPDLSQSDIRANDPLPPVTLMVSNRNNPDAHEWWSADKGWVTKADADTFTPAQRTEIEGAGDTPTGGQWIETVKPTAEQATDTSADDAAGSSTEDTDA